MMQALRPCWMSLDEKRWLFDEASWTLADWFVIKNVTGLGRVPFINGVLEEDPAALQALVWFLRRKDEPNLTLGEVMFRPADLSYEAVEEPEVIDPPSEGGDVVTLPPRTSDSDGTTTSTTSPAGATSAPGMSTP